MSDIAMDDVDEEEVVFDQTTLLTSRIKSTSQRERSSRCFKIVQTFLLCAAFFGLGLCIAMPGPTLLDLEARTNTNTSRISQIFTGRSVGYLFGSISGGFLYDRLNQNCLLSFTLLLTAVGTALAPWSKNFMLLMVFIALQGISMGFLDTGGNVFCMTIWGRNSPPYMQALHFSFGLGAFVAPLLAEPFLSKANTTTHPLLYGHIVTSGDDDKTDSAGDEAVKDKIQRFIREPPQPPQSAKPTSDHKVPKPRRPISSADFLSPSSDIASGKNLKKIKEQESAAKTTPSPSAQTNSSQLGNLTGIGTKQMSTTTATTTSTTAATTTTRTTPAPTPTLKTKASPGNSNEKSDSRSLYSLMDDNSTQTNDTNGAGTSTAELLESVTKVMKLLTNVQFAYLAIAAYLVLIALCFMVMCCCSKQGVGAVKNQEIESEYMIRQETKGFRVQILVLMFFFYFLYVGMEVTFGGLIMTFAVKYLGWTKAEGTMLTSVFWGSFALARGISIFFGVCLSPALMLIGDLVMTCLSLAGLVMALDSNHMILWFCTAVLGAGMASIFPTGITWAERYMRMTGKATSVLVVGSALGEMCMPALTGFLFETKGPMWLLYIMLGAGLLSAILYIIMQNLASNKGERYEKLTQWLGSSSTDSGTEDQDMEMDSLASNSTTNLLEMVSPSSTTSNGSSGKKKVSFNLPKDLTPKSIANKYRPTFLGKNNAKRD